MQIIAGKTIKKSNVKSVMETVRNQYKFRNQAFSASSVINFPSKNTGYIG